MHPSFSATHVATPAAWARAASQARKAALFLFSLVLLLAGASARGQSALDGFNPNANDVVRVVVVQPDGKILIGGPFTSLSPNGGGAVARNGMARLNADGTLDTGFNPNVAGSVEAIALQADGKIVVGGSFSSVNGQVRTCMARLDATTGLPDSFDPNPTGTPFSPAVIAVAVQADGKIIAAGSFETIGGQTRHNIARLDPTTGLADSFDPDANLQIQSIVVQPDGRILAAGYFTSIGGQMRNRIARLDPTTGLADSFNPNADELTYAIALQADGKILVGGNFAHMGGQVRNRIARLDPITGLVDSFNPQVNGGALFCLAVQADGKILMGGSFFNVGGQPRENIARVDPITGGVDSFNPGAGDYVFSIAIQADGKILVGGYPMEIGGQLRGGISRLETDGRVDQTLNVNSVGDFVTAIAVQPDGKILIGGSFDSVLGVARNGIARLNTDGTLDTVFNPNGGAIVYAFAVQADGKILVGGVIDSINGQPRNNIARLDGTTGLPDSFNPNANSTVFSIVVQTDGKILVGGSFNSIGGQPRNYIARLDAATGLADSFNPNPNVQGFVGSIALQADGKILVGGHFSSIGGQPRNRIARLDAATGLADSFNPNASSQVRAFAVQPDGKILTAGDFNGPNSIGGQARNYIARLDAITGLADSFDPDPNFEVQSIALQADGKVLAGGSFTAIGGQPRKRIARLDGITGLADSFDPNANSSVSSVALQADGKILAGGAFNAIGGQRRRHFARLSNDTAALRHLAVTQSTITWTLGGSSPQFTRVTFASSGDNVIYTPPFSATAAGNTWIMTGLSFAAGNFYVRARGYYRHSYGTNSESIAESVRNAFIAGPPLTPSPSPTATATAPPTPSPTPTLAPTPMPTPTPDPSPWAQAINLSTRMNVQTGDNVGIGGFIIAGPVPKYVLLRAIGPSLAQFGIPNPLADPVMELHGVGGFVTITNDNWRDDPVQEAAIIATGIPPTNNLESAIVLALNPGSYTAIVRGQSNGTGVGLVEVYDLSQPTPGKLANISTRALVGTGSDIVIAGFILGGNKKDDHIIVRGIGPSLTALGIGNALANPTLELRDSSGSLMIANNDWQDDAGMAAQLIAAGLAPPNNLESGIAASLPPGLYTALLAGVNNGTGVGLVEVYDRGGGGGVITTPSPTATATATAVPTATGTVSPTPTATATASPTPTATIVPTPTPTPIPLCFLNQEFQDITTLPGAGWALINHSTTVGTTGWFQGNSAVFPAHVGFGGATSYIAANYNNNTNPNPLSPSLSTLSRTLREGPATPPTPTIPPPSPTPGGPNTISNWLLTQPLTLLNGARMTFFTRTVDVPQFPDRLQVRMSTNGTSTDVGTTAADVGDFNTLMLDINPTYTTTGYPNVWTQFTVTVTGVPSLTTGRLAFRYFVENGGPNGQNSDYIGIDTVGFQCVFPTPSPTATPSSAPGWPDAEGNGTAPGPIRTPIPSPGPNAALNVIRQP